MEGVLGDLLQDRGDHARVIVVARMEERSMSSQWIMTPPVILDMARRPSYAPWSWIGLAGGRVFRSDGVHATVVGFDFYNSRR